MTEPSMALVFAAGLLSFLSPCVLPLLPSYLGILGSVKTGGGRRGVLFAATASFILGFSAVFVIFSMLVSAAFFFMGSISKYIRTAAGLVVIILGLNVLFDFLAILNYEKRPAVKKPQSFAGTFLAGAAFGTGWTPCIGPVLAGVLLLAGQSGKAGTAALYLGVYSLGLGLPFLLAAAFLDRFLVPAGWFRSRMPWIKKISGGILIVMGLLILSGRFSALTELIQQWQYRFTGWAEDKDLPFRLAAAWFKALAF
ncbi:MAG: cytochrome c biogenesis protein CcdA [Treponema sp.]|jgi:cytochrome c-type biogenesis protein|nr:cytochrome c biogenesis protein CcdA [Treponema sp.]